MSILGEINEIMYAHDKRILRINYSSQLEMFIQHDETACILKQRTAYIRYLRKEIVLKIKKKKIKLSILIFFFIKSRLYDISEKK